MSDSGKIDEIIIIPDIGSSSIKCYMYKGKNGVFSAPVVLGSSGQQSAVKVSINEKTGEKDLISLISEYSIFEETDVVLNDYKD